MLRLRAVKTIDTAPPVALYVTPMITSSPISPPDWFLPAREGELLAVETARGHLSALQSRLAMLPTTEGRDIYVLDAANRFDAYAFSHAIPPPPLERIFISRAFTIHQLEAAAAQLLPGLVLLSPRPFFLVLGIEHLFKEETLPQWEKIHTLKKTLNTLSQMTREKLPIVVTHEPPQDPRRDWWASIIRNACHDARRWQPQIQTTR